MLKQGQVLNNRYQVQTVLGQGGFGAVYKGWDDNLQRHCAIKENLQVTPEAQKQFKREAVMLANLNHPHLVRVTDYFIIPNQGQYLVMDFVDGIDLQTALINYGKALPLVDTLKWTLQICEALIYIHNQNPPIIHHDIKPANIRVTPQGNAVLVDFGLAKAFEANAKTSTGARGLTPYFAAPEQYGMGGTDAQSDIYSLGVTLYCMLTNSVPADSVDIMVGNAEPPPPAKTINNNIPEFVSDALQRAMQIRRTERYKSAGDFKTALLAEQKPFAQVSIVEQPAFQAANFTDNKLTLSNGMEFMRVPAGKFIMGSNDDGDDENPQHTVELSEYLIGKYPVTNCEYQAFVRDAKYKSPENWVGDQFPANKGNHPVVYVSWNDASAYCKWLSEKTGEQYRLPTEAEWEKAARGTDGRVYPWGDDFDPQKANTEESEINDTTDVGKFSPQGDSPYGCADMAGNVWEWCNDRYSDTYYKSSLSSNPLGPDSGQYRVLRGGAWNINDFDVRSAYRYKFAPRDSYYRFIGFRCARSLPLLENLSPKESQVDHESPKPVQVITSRVSKNVSAWTAKGNGLVSLGRYEEAISYIDKVLEIDSRNVAVLTNKGLCLNSLGRYEDAIHYLDQALEIDPRDVATLNNKGDSLNNLDRYEEAIHYLDQALEIDPRNMVVLNNKANSLNSLGHYEEAIHYFDKVLEIDPRHIGAWFGKSFSLDRLGRKREAAQSYRQFIALAPTQHAKQIEYARKRIMELESK